jgi:hypothetical protein
MKEQLVTFDTAKLAKEKGFDESCNDYYDFNKKIQGFAYYEFDRENSNLKTSLANAKYSAPTQSLLQRWLREVHNIYVNVNPITLNDGKPLHSRSYPHKYHYSIYPFARGTHKNTYEEALEIGLQEGLTLIKL